jgi:hypothetical protein
MPDNSPALVVVAAGGLGTRVHPWARFIPKEFYPVVGRPGITLLLDEIVGLGPARVVIVYHPYCNGHERDEVQLTPRSHHPAGPVPAANAVNSYARRLTIISPQADPYRICAG